MNKSIVLIALFCGAFFGVNKAEATVGLPKIFKGLESVQLNPFDPRKPREEQEDESKDDHPEIRIPIK